LTTTGKFAGYKKKRIRGFGMPEQSKTFDDFSSSRNRQQRITRVAIGAGVILALFLAVKFINVERKDDLPPGTLARIDEMQGQLMIKRGANTVNYAPGFMVLAGDKVRTIGDSAAVISYMDDGTRITLGPDSSIMFNGSTGGKRTNLNGGSVTLDIREQPEDQPMVLVSNNAEAIVRAPGTVVQTSIGLATRFDVKSGQLEVRRYSDGHITDVRAGQSHTCRPDDAGVISFNPNGLE
jgi:hypothetical protein